MTPLEQSAAVLHLCRIGAWVQAHIWDDATANEYRDAAIAYADDEVTS